MAGLIEVSGRSAFRPCADQNQFVAGDQEQPARAIGDERKGLSRLRECRLLEPGEKALRPGTHRD